MATYNSTTTNYISSWIFDDDQNWGKADIKEYNISPVSVTGLSIFLLIACIMLSINVIATNRQYRKLSSSTSARNQKWLWWTNVRTRLNCILILGSFLHVMNTVYFVIMETGRWLPCSVIVTMGGVIYSSMVICVSSVMIQRSTTLLQGRYRQGVRLVMYLVIFLGVGFTAASNAFRVWNYGLAKLGVCSAMWNRKLNTIGKLLITLVYICFLFVFVMPLYRHSQAMRQLTSHHANQTSKKLDQMVQRLFMNISFCIFALVAGTIIGTFQLFGRYTTLEFSIQNTAMVYASTLALERFGKRRNKTSSDTGSSCTGMSQTNVTARVGTTLVTHPQHTQHAPKITTSMPILPSPSGKSFVQSGGSADIYPKPMEIAHPKKDQAMYESLPASSKIPITVVDVDQQLKRVCSGVWVDEETEETCIEMGSSMSLSDHSIANGFDKPSFGEEEVMDDAQVSRRQSLGSIEKGYN